MKSVKNCTDRSWPRPKSRRSRRRRRRATRARCSGRWWGSGGRGTPVPVQWDARDRGLTAPPRRARCRRPSGAARRVRRSARLRRARSPGRRRTATRPARTRTTAGTQTCSPDTRMSTSRAAEK